MNDKLLVKYSEHRYVMYKLVYLSKHFPKSNGKKTKIVWIYITNNDATNLSSSEDDEKMPIVQNQVKKEVSDIIMKYFIIKKSLKSRHEPKCKANIEAVAKGKPNKVKKYRGVQQRPSKRCVAEIRDSL